MRSVRLGKPQRSAEREKLIAVEPLEARLLFAVFNVDTTADVLMPPPGVVSLRSAVEGADTTPGDNTLNLTVPGTYRITLAGASGESDNAAGEFAIMPAPSSPAGSTLSIVNSSGGQVVVDAAQLARAFDISSRFNIFGVSPAFNVVMHGFTVEDGLAADPMNPDGANASGGGIRAKGNVRLTLTDMIVRQNSASADGGGISFENAISQPWTLTVNGSTIIGNHAGDTGGGIESDGSGTVSVNAGSVISSNTAVNEGGGIWLDAIQSGLLFQSAVLNVVGATVTNNVSLTAVAGGIGDAGGGAVSISTSTISGNHAAGSGGGLADENGQAAWTLLQTLMRDNSAGVNGGAIATSGPGFTITSSQVQDNSAGKFGGGIFASCPTLSVQRSTLAGNTSAASGGAAEIQTTGTGGAASLIVDSTLVGNDALNNTGGTTGGGIDAPSAFTGSLMLLNDTIDANLANDGGGIFWAGAGVSSVALENTILAANSANIGPDANNPAGSFIDHGGNLIGVSGAGGGNTGFTTASTLTGTVVNPLNPALGPLADNNGPTVGAGPNAITLQTQEPTQGSPVIGKGIASAAPATDERGFPSVVNGLANIGAVSNTAASIAGSIFNDLANAGLRQPADPGLGGVIVYIDVGGTGQLEPGDPIAVTDASGNYTFPNLFAGSYVIRESVPTGYALTAPLGYRGSVAVATAQAAAGPVFGDVQLSHVLLNFDYLVRIARHFGQAGTFATGDLNGDGVVNFQDLVLLARNYGHALPALTTAASASIQPSVIDDPLTLAHRRRTRG